MKVVANAQQTWNEYSRLFLLRKLSPPPHSEHALFIVHGEPQRPEMVAGFCMYPTKGPYVFCEHLVTNPGVRPMVRHKGLCVLLGALKLYCASTGKVPLIVARHKGLVKVLMRAGYLPQQALVLTAVPEMEIP